MSRPNVQELLAQSLVMGIEGLAASEEELALVSDPGVGGVILFSRNYQNPEQLWRLTSELRRAAALAGRPPLLVMVDQEGGSVVRLGPPFMEAPDFKDKAKEGVKGLLAYGRAMARELEAAGVNWNLAPVLDVHLIPGGIMETRSLGSDPRQVAKLGRAFINGLHQGGCLACAKHFPGLGRTLADTHQERTRVGLSRQELEKVELVPFVEAMVAGVDGVMVSHAVYEDLDPYQPASLSAVVVQGLLRSQLGWRGVVLSDDLEMGAIAGGMVVPQAAVMAFQAGCDLLLICHQHDLLRSALEQLTMACEDGRISPERLEASQRRLGALKYSLAPLPPDLDQLRRLLGMME